MYAGFFDSQVATEEKHPCTYLRTYVQTPRGGAQYQSGRRWW